MGFITLLIKKGEVILKDLYYKRADADFIHLCALLFYKCLDNILSYVVLQVFSLILSSCTLESEK